MPAGTSLPIRANRIAPRPSSAVQCGMEYGLKAARAAASIASGSRNSIPCSTQGQGQRLRQRRCPIEARVSCGMNEVLASRAHTCVSARLRVRFQTEANAPWHGLRLLTFVISNERGMLWRIRS